MTLIVHWCLDICLNDDQARARVKNSAQNLAIPVFARFDELVAGLAPAGVHPCCAHKKKGCNAFTYNPLVLLAEWGKVVHVGSNKKLCSRCA